MFNKKKLAEIDAKIAKHERAVRRLLADQLDARAAGDFETEHVYEDCVHQTDQDLLRLKAERIMLLG